MPARIQLFGNLQFLCDGTAATGVNANRLQSLLAFLVLRASAPQSREQLASLLWPESEQGQARTNLRQLMHALRRALPANYCLLQSDHHTVQWSTSPDVSVDVHQFNEFRRQASTAQRQRDDDSECRALLEAAELYQDELARGIYDDWVVPVREDYRQQIVDLLVRLASLLEKRGDLAGAIRQAERLVSLDSLREPHHQLLIRLHLANHDRASALRVYHQCMRTLRRELGVDPDAVTQELFQRALKSQAPKSQATQSEALQPEAASAGLGPATPAPRRDEGMLPMVGREREWRQLLNRWELASEGSSHIVVIMGEAGIGKSRLAEEIYAWRAAQQDARVGRARCYLGQGQPALAYSPIGDWLRSGTLRHALKQLPERQLQELARVLPEVLSENPAIPRPGPLKERWERQHFFDALHAALHQPPHSILLFLDDLQWCDQETIEYLQTLFLTHPKRGILLVATLRDEETDRNHPATRLRTELLRAGCLTEIALEPLSADQTSTLAQNIADHPTTAEELSELYRATKGHPLFIVESIRAGVKNPEAARRIHAVIATRLAQLSPEAYDLAELAAVVGAPFTFDLLAKASDWDESSLSRALDELWRRRLLDNPSGVNYDFSHDRIREVAREQLSPVRKRFLHRRVARALKELHGEDMEGSLILAAHYDEAGMTPEAIACYSIAATAALNRFADKEAAAMLRRAIALCAQLPESARRDQSELDLFVTLGPVLVRTLGYAAQEVGDAYTRALALSQSLRETKHLPFILAGAWVYHNVRAVDFEVTLQTARQLMELGKAQGGNTQGGSTQGDALLVAADFELGCTLFHLGRFEESFGHMMRVTSMHGKLPHEALALFAGPDIGVFAQSYVAHLLWHRGFPDQALEAIHEAIAAAERVGSPFSMAIALDYAALLHAFQRAPEGGLQYAREAIAVCQKYEFAYYGSIAEIVAGWALSLLDDPRTGLAQLRAGLDALKSTGARLRLPFYHGLLAEACAGNSNIGEALANLSTAFAFQSGEIWMTPILQRIQESLLRASSPETAKIRS
jgi:DNA-binding SARP family transcriptional activator